MKRKPLPLNSLADSIESKESALSVSELAGLVNLTPTTIYTQIKAKTLPALKVGSSYRLDPKSTAAWLRGLTV